MPAQVEVNVGAAGTDTKLDVLLVATIDAVGITRLPRILQKAGCRVTVLCSRKLALRRSCFVGRWIEGPRQPEAMAAALRDHLMGHVGKYRLVIATDEPLLWVLRESGDAWLAPWFPAPLGGANSAAVFSKLAFALAAQEQGIGLPRWRLCRSLDEARHVAAEFGYPVVLKSDHGLSGSGTRVSGTPEQLEEDFRTLDAAAGLVVQAFVRGELGTTPVLFDRGRLCCWFSAYAREQWPTRFASSTALEIADPPGMPAILEAIGRFTGFNGLCGVDWIEEEVTGRTLLLELNPRPTPGLYLGPHAGVDFSLAIRDWLAGVPRVQPPRLASGEPKALVMFPQALYRAIDDRRVNLGLRALADIPWDDPLLVGAHLRRLVTHYARRVLGR